MSTPIKVIDLFAGPGGLGEGFSAVGPDNSPLFKIVVSVEKEISAHKTLTLRAFTREFSNRILPKEYYKYIRGEIDKKALINAYPTEWAAAEIETFGKPLALGEDNDIIHKGISTALGENKAPWVLIGGPPCQAYSLAGRSRNLNNANYEPRADHRHFLYKEYLDVIKKFKPSVFVMENVKGILSSSPTGTPIFDQILTDLRNPCEDLDDLKYDIFSLSTPSRSSSEVKSEYHPKDFIIKSENYGIPQARHRVILLGVRSDISSDTSDIILNTSSQVSVGQVLAEMPRLRSGLSKEQDTPQSWSAITSSALKNAAEKLSIDMNEIEKHAPPTNRGTSFSPRKKTLSKVLPDQLRKWLGDENIKGVIQHETRGHMSSDLVRYTYISLFGQIHKRSPVISELPKELLPNHKNATSGHFVDRFKVQLAHAPSKTITCHISKDSHAFIHYDPTQSRGLTVREAARLQTFPENYFFEGNRTQQYVQVGNAVPPYLAWQIGTIVSNILGLPDNY